MIFWNLVQFRAVRLQVALGSINEWLYVYMWLRLQEYIRWISLSWLF